MACLACFVWACVVSAQLSAAQVISTKKIYTVAFAQDNMANDWRAAQVRQFADFFKAHPEIRFIYTDGNGSTAKQIQDIEDLVYSRVDVLITSPRDSMAMTPVIRSAYKKGIPVVLVTRTIQGDDYTSFIAPDDELIGHRAAKFLARTLRGNGSVLIIQGIPTATTSMARTRGFKEELKNYPNIKIASVLNGNYLRGDTIIAMQKVINEHLPFDAIYAQSDSMASAARLALKKANISPRTKHIVGIDYIQEAHDAIIKGEQAASFVYSTSAIEAGEIVLKIIHGEKVPKKVSVPAECITSENVNLVAPLF